MKYFHHLRIRIIANQDEIDALQDKAVLFLDLDEKEQRSLSIEREIDESVVIVHIWLKKDRLIKQVARKLSQFEAHDVFIANLDERIFDDGYFYLRTDTNIEKIVTGGKCIHFAFKVAAYPRGLDRAKQVAHQFFQH